MSLPEEMYADLKAQLPALTEAIKSGAEWGTDLAHRFILYDIFIQVLACVILLGLIGLTTFFTKKIHKWLKKGHEDANSLDKVDWTAGKIFVLGLIIPFIYIFLGVGLWHPLITIIKDIFIPEIRILEILSDLI